MPDPKVSEISVIPSKDLFISMLVKDITINEAILDLIDNSVDGATRTRKKASFEGLFININLTKDKFTIEDNCGGIPDDKVEYTFKFGRDEADQQDPATAAMEAQERKLGLIGRYGIGMKRAIFKLGRGFRVESSDGKTYFTVNVDIEEWRKAKGDWTFPVKWLDVPMLAPDSQQPLEGTVITVTALLDAIKEQAEKDKFLKSLIKEIGQRHEQPMAKGLEITVNNTRVQHRPGSLLQSDNIVPAYEQMTLQGTSGNIVKVEIYAGIGEATGNIDRENSTVDMGWHIYGNGRLIIRADKTALTGWGEQGSIRIPQQHFQFARFRGYVFFYSDDARDIPWDTTKTGIDQDSPIYQAVRQRMLVYMRQVIDVLNKLKAEREGSSPRDTNKGPIAMTLKTAKAVPLDEVSRKRSQFTLTISKEIASKAAKMVRIAFKKPADEIDQLKQCMNIDNANDIGAETFRYYLEQVCDE